MPEGKIVKALSGFYYVQHEEGITQCRGRGVFRKNKITPLVGDQVVFRLIIQVKDTCLKYLIEKMNLSGLLLLMLIKQFLFFSSRTRF